MRGVLKWVGETIGGFCAAFLVYLVVGVLVGWAIATPFGEIGHGCWPTTSFFRLVVVPCDDALGVAFWSAIVEIPNILLFFSVTALKGSSPLGVSVAALGATVVMSSGGFFAWYRRAPLVAAMLALALVAEIVVMGWL